MSWQVIADQRCAHLARTLEAVDPPIPAVPDRLPCNVAAIPQQLLSSHVIEITQKSPEQLISDLGSGKISSEAVTKAFLQRAGLASKLSNCLTELLPSRAVDRAKSLDSYLAQHGKPVGPLHGLPVSIKEHLALKGLDLNAGFVSWVGRVAADDALILKLLWKAGAVFYARTTEPQTLMHLETSSNIHGVTVNPYNNNLTAGGSSGGEGALIGLRGSPLGVGTDIGGSIRSPAAANGLFGLRPTSYRLPADGMAGTMQGEEQIIATMGPLSTSLEGIKIFMKAIIDQQPWLYDPLLAPIAWRDFSQRTLLRVGSDGRKKLRVGILADDGIVKPHPPILRAIRTLVDRLQGHPDIEIVDFPAYKHDEAWRIISSLYFADGGREESEAIDASGEPWRPLSKFIIKENPNVKELSVQEIWKLTAERNGFRAAYTRHWNSIGTGLPGPDAGVDLTVDLADVRDLMVDVLLCPAGPSCAPLLDTARYWAYLSTWNLVDYPALVFPTGLACGPEDAIDKEWTPRNEVDRYNHNLYDPIKYKDAPISLQLVGRRYEEEKVIEALEMMLEISGIPRVCC